MSPKERASNVIRATAWNKANAERRRAIKKRYYAANRERALETNRRWYRDNAPKMAQVNRQWKAENPGKVIEMAARRRALKLGTSVSTITARQLAELLEKQNGCCAYCSTILDDERHLDHVHPLSRGGAHVLGNLAWTCQPCNLAKGTKLVSEWLTARKENAQ